MADLVPNQRGTGKRLFVPVSEVIEVTAEPAPDPVAWQVDLAAADDIFGPDELTDPFDREER